MNRVILLSVTLLLIVAVCPEDSRIPVAAETASPADLKLDPLYVHVSRRGYRLYKLGPSLPSGLSDGPWKTEGAVGLVARDPAPGTRPVYQLSKADTAGVRFDYSANSNYVKKATSGATLGHTWTDSGVAFHVAATQVPGTVPLFRIHKAPGLLVTGPDAGKLAPGSDATILTTDAALKEKLVNEGWKDGHALGYVWTKAPESSLPDLSVKQVNAEEFSVKALIVNEGKGNIGAAHLYAHLFLLDNNGKVLFSDGKFVGDIAPGGSRPLSFETGGRSLVGLRYQIKVDISNLVKESNEANNVTQLAAFHKKIKIHNDPDAGNRVPLPSILLTAIHPSANGAVYRLALRNSEAYETLLQSTQVLAPKPCGVGQTDARLIIRFSLLRDGQLFNAGCMPVKTSADLKKMDFSSKTPPRDSDRLRVMLEDRETGQKYASEAYVVGWFGLDKTLVPAGCKSFLGRAGSYLCTTNQGMNLCEDFRQKGKPIQCTRAGKQAQ